MIWHFNVWARALSSTAQLASFGYCFIQNCFRSKLIYSNLWIQKASFLSQQLDILYPWSFKRNGLCGHLLYFAWLAESYSLFLAVPPLSPLRKKASQDSLCVGILAISGDSPTTNHCLFTGGDVTCWRSVIYNLWKAGSCPVASSSSSLSWESRRSWGSDPVVCWDVLSRWATNRLLLT